MPLGSAQTFPSFPCSLISVWVSVNVSWGTDFACDVVTYFSVWETQNVTGSCDALAVVVPSHDLRLAGCPEGLLFRGICSCAVLSFGEIASGYVP